MTKAVVWNLLGTIAVVLTMVVTVPLFLHVYGPTRYGIIATLWAVLGYFSLLDFGMGPAIVNFLSQPEAREREAASRIFWTAFVTNVATGTALGCLIVVSLELMRDWGFFARSAFDDELFAALPWAMVMFPVALTYPILVGALDARNRFGLANVNQVIGGVLIQVLPLVATLAFRPTLAVAVAASVLGRVLSAGLLLAAVLKVLGATAFRFDRRLISRLFSFGGWVAIGSAAGSLLETADRLVIGSTLGGAAAAWYSIAYSTVARVRTLPYAVVRALFPRIAAQSHGVDAQIALSARVMALLLVPGISLSVIFIEPAFRIWLGATAAAATTPVARLMLAGMFLNCIAHLATTKLQAQGTPARLAKTHLAELPLFLVAIWLAARWYGVEGAALTWAIRLMIDAVLLFVIADLRLLLNATTFLDTLTPFLCCAATMLPSWPFGQRAALGLGIVVAWMAVDAVMARRQSRPVTLFTICALLTGEIRAKLARS